MARQRDNAHGVARERPRGVRSIIGIIGRLHAEGSVEREEREFRDLPGEMNRRADQHARIVRARGKYDFDRAEWQADDRTGNLDRRRDDGGGAVESVGSGGDRRAKARFLTVISPVSTG